MISMEYLYANLLLEECGTAVDEAGLTRVLEASGVTPDTRDLHAFLAGLDEMNLDEAQ